ncbi:amidase family protein [Dactylosporangium sp. AC04546]|uniref:amidase family protein n=1 Tax=Dactylosporangium sp. AC04546 TaxID=2862460 RepID=UPI001EDE7E0B|nr:amidase family protein [Dactylosporangium sp. AC04546]WVK85927.1 amidase family protein [Dactylosporangium sp. AC04546]
MSADPTVWRVKGMPLAPATGHGPLDGLRVAVKDLFAVTGFAVGGGNPSWLAEALPAHEDAPAVARLRAAGAVVQGIAHTDELAYSLSGTNVHYGTPPNPAAPDRVTAGSSSGPASAVATGHADVGLGTDTGGSIRVPASCCGLFGLRPTHGAVPTGGVLPLAPSFDTVGWITADAATLARVGDVLLPDGPDDLPRRFLSLGGTEGEAGRWGRPVSAVTLSTWDDPDPLLLAFRQVQAAEAWRAHGKWIEAHPRALAADVEGRFRFGATVDPATEDAARAMLAAWRRELLDLLGEGDDAWLVLPAGGPGHLRELSLADKDAWRRETLRCAVPASAYGLPSVSLPALTRPAGSPPAGIAVIAPPGRDRALLRLANGG